MLTTEVSNNKHSRCGYINDIAGRNSFRDNPNFFQVIHPVLWEIGLKNGNLVLKTTPFNTDQNKSIIINAIKSEIGEETLIWPMVNGDVDQSVIDQLAAILRDPDPTLRQAHAKDLVKTVLNDNSFNDVGGIAGIEIDYEHFDNSVTKGFQNLFKDIQNNPDASGKQISASFGAVTAVDVSDDPKGHMKNDWNSYQYFAQNIDIVHVQLYDFHYRDRKDGNGKNHLGPLAPKGWVKSVLDNIKNNATTDNGGKFHPELAQKFIYTMPNYGLAAADGDPTAPHEPPDPDPHNPQRPGSLDWNYSTLNQELNCCTPNTFSPKSDHMKNCSYDPDHKYFDSTDQGLDPNCKSSNNSNCTVRECTEEEDGQKFLLPGKEYTLFFDTVESLQERLLLAKEQYSIGGASIWTVGHELPGFFNMVQSIFNVVTIGDNFFRPQNLTVALGTTVHWTNTGGSLHTVTSNPGSLGCSPSSTENFASITLNNGDSFDHRFNTSGSFSYHCEIHGCNMSGTITVK